MKALSKSLLLASFSLMCFSGIAQEMLVDLHSNPRLGAWEEAARRHVNNSRAAGDTLALPFFDDFSEPFSRLNHPHDLYPSLDRWIGKTVYVNNHMAINPPSQGVATFDGLNENGLAYGFGFSTPTLSDSLTSKPIDLSSASDTVYLSFFYQAQGMGDAPEEDDIMICELKDTADTWTRVWEAPGYILEDYKFHVAMIPVLGEEYLFNGFQFRFMNLSSRSGSVDLWHIDYVELDEARSYSDTVYNDLAYLGQNFYVDETHGVQSTTASLLSEYHSMPWTHFKVDPAEYMADSSYVGVRNNDTIVVGAADFFIRIQDLNGTQLFENEVSSPEIFGSTICGSRHRECNDDPADRIRSYLEDFVLPSSPELSEDSSHFIVKNVMIGGADDVASNDTSVYVQRFHNYYAYDDGTAEVAYGLGNLETSGSVAVRFSIKEADQMQAIQIYLNPVGEDVSEVPVKLMVWSGVSEPETVLYESPEFITLSYSNGINYFYNYALEEALDVGETILWVGWKQQPVTGLKFSVGFDQRTDNSENVYYNLGTTWNQSSIPGSVMIRPIFGEAFDWVAGVEENSNQGLSVFPNPTEGMLHITEQQPGQFQEASISILDITGREVVAPFRFKRSIDVSRLSSGTYIVKVQQPTGQTFVQRVVVKP